MNQELDRLIRGYHQEILRDTKRLLAFNSIYAEDGGPGQPFGKAIDAALEDLLALARELGFAAFSYDGYMGVIDFGDPGQGEQIGAIAHIDIVPAGEGWIHPPFAGVVEDDKLYGRGALDDKGPLIALLYALKAIKDSGLPLKHHFRFLIGTDEESGFRCIQYYLQREKQPLCGFSPDGEFPVIYGEKGIYRYYLQGSWPDPLPTPPDCWQVLRFAGGERVNVIPEEAWVELAGNQALLAQAQAALSSFAEADKLRFTVQGDQLRLVANGKSAHSSLPWHGDNAINILLRFLQLLPLAPNGAGAYLHSLAALFADGYLGAAMGIAAPGDDEFSPLTNSLTVLRGDQYQAEAKVDIRYPNLAERAQIWQTVQNNCAARGLKVELWQDKPGIYTGQQSPLVQSLYQAYCQVSGRAEPPVTIGGGTYCRALTDFVAFGPLFPGQIELAHERNEYIGVEDLLLCARIYTQAAYALLNTDYQK